MAKTMTQLNKTNQEQLEAEKKKVISITIQASNNKVKEKRKRVVQKGKNIEEPIKKISKETKKASKNIIVAPRKELMKINKINVKETEEEEEVQASNNKVKDKRKKAVQKGKNIEEPIKKISKETKKASKKIIVAPRKELMKKKKRNKKETEEEEEVGYIVEKLVNDRKRKNIWEVEVKWKDHDETTWEPMKSIKEDTPEIVKEYMNEMNEMSKKKKAANNKKKKTKPKGVKKLVCMLKHDRKSSFKMEKDIRVFTGNGKMNMMECEDCDKLLMPSKNKPVYLCKDTSCDLGVCFKCYHAYREKKTRRLIAQLQ